MINSVAAPPHQLLCWLCLAIGGLIFCWMIYASIKARCQSAKPFHRSVISELTWQLIPLIIVVLLIWPTMTHIYHA
ncbi:hypothetical protein N9Y17_00620 [Gammaproteobacteria bacterium]|nr:hypothetical protein [Gammaproteobacteria bacterium]